MKWKKKDKKKKFCNSLPLSFKVINSGKRRAKIIAMSREYSFESR